MSSLYNIIEGPEIIIKKIKKEGSLSNSIIQEILNLEKFFKSYLVTIIYEIKKDRLIEIFIHNCQQRLTLLSNEVYNNLKSEPQMEDAQKCLDIVAELLQFLENTFPKYFNRFESISLKYRFELSPKFSAEVTEISTKIPSPLIQLVFKPILEFIDGNNAFNYHQVTFFKNLLNYLNKFDSSENDSEFLKRTLILLNYNSLPVLHYYISEMNDEIEEMDTRKSKIYYLRSYHKWLNQLPSGNVALNPEHNSLSEMLLKWISEEITFFEKDYGNSETIEKDSFKFLTELTVPQLAFILRLFFDTKIILNDNNKAAVQFLAQHSKSKSGDQISPTSLLNKFYIIKPNVVEEVKGILIRLLNQLHKY